MIYVIIRFHITLHKKGALKEPLTMSIAKPKNLKEKLKITALYKKVKSQLKKDKRTGLLLKRVPIKLPESNETAVKCLKSDFSYFILIIVSHLLLVRD